MNANKLIAKQICCAIKLLRNSFIAQLVQEAYATRFIAIIPIGPHDLRRSDKVRHGFHDSIHDLQDALRSLQSKDKNY